jgi:hypothetical protein
MIPFWCFEVGLGSSLWNHFSFSITREYSSFEHQFPGKQDLIRENGLRIRTQRGQITLGHIAVF